MSVVVWLLLFQACQGTSPPGQLRVHVLFHQDVTKTQHDWSMSLIHRSVYKAVTVEEHLLQRMHSRDLIELLVTWQRFLTSDTQSQSIVILVVAKTSTSTSYITDQLTDTFLISFKPTENTQASFCAGGKIKLNAQQTSLDADHYTFASDVFPTTLVDYVALCYNIDHETQSMIAACVNGNVVNETCICDYGFTGDRCQFSDLADLDCSPGYSLMNVNSEPICHCPLPAGGRQYCGPAPCPGQCEYCSRRHSGNICGVMGVELEMVQSDTSPDSATSVATTVTQKSSTVSPIKTSCKNGKQVGSDCICVDGYTGQDCEIGPLYIDCQWENIRVNISHSYRSEIANYYVPNGSFHLCQSRESCQLENCQIEQSFVHGNTDCGARVTRTKSTTTVENNVFWKIPGRNSFIQTGHYECIYEDQVNINTPNANISCCRQSTSHIVEHTSFVVQPQLWRRDKDGSYQLITDSSSWIVDEPIILRLTKSDYSDIRNYQYLGFESCLLVNHQEMNLATIKLPIIEHGCPTKFARERLALNMSTTTHDSISFIFKAFNWKYDVGGQVYAHCEFTICEECNQECSSRARRDVVHLEAKMVGHGHMSTGPMNARSKEDDVITKEQLIYYQRVNGIISCVVGIIFALVLYKLIKKIVTCAVDNKQQ